MWHGTLCGAGPSPCALRCAWLCRRCCNGAGVSPAWLHLVSSCLPSPPSCATHFPTGCAMR